MIHAGLTFADRGLSLEEEILEQFDNNERRQKCT